VSAVRRVVAGVSGSPGSLQALRFAVDVGRTTGAWVTPVLAWLPPGGDFADRRHPSAYLRQIWKEDAWQRLWRAIDMGIGGVPADIPFEPVVLRGETGAVLTGVACRSGDVLVIGAGRRGGPLRRLAAGHVSRYCLAHASCPVTAVPPSGLEAATHGIRGWALRHRGLTPQDADLHAADA
jgi:nucleotide-binding universal stress UspA family protein